MSLRTTILTSLLPAAMTIALLDCTALAAQLDWTPDQVKIEARKAEASFDAKGKLKIRSGAEEAGSVTLRPRRATVGKEMYELRYRENDHDPGKYGGETAKGAML